MPLRVAPQKTFYRYSSYGLKHLAESWLGAYVANGTFIAAAIYMGFRWKRSESSSPNVHFNMSKKDLNALRKEADAQAHARHTQRQARAEAGGN